MPAGYWWEYSRAESEAGSVREQCPATYRLPSLPGDAHVEVVQEVGAAAQAQDGVGQLQGEMRRLAQLTGFMQAGGERKS